MPAEEFVGKTKVGAYGDFVHQTDWSIGQVLDALDRAGVTDNTLVIFTSDNGSEITGEVNLERTIAYSSLGIAAQANSVVPNAMLGKVVIEFLSSYVGLARSREFGKQ